MFRNRIVHHRIIIGLIVLTIVLFVAFDIIAQFIVSTEFDERARDSIRFQANETAEVLKDLEDGMSLIDKSYEFNEKRALKSQVDLTVSVMNALREQSDLSVEEIQLDVLRRMDAYRRNIDGTIAIYSRNKGMLLYPSGDVGRLNIYFNAKNKDLLEQAIENGSLFGTIECSDVFQGELYLNGYFTYDSEWNWLIFSVKRGELAQSYKSYGEFITIKSGLKKVEQFDIIDAAYVLDSDYFYEYGVDSELIGRKSTKVDLKTNKALYEIYEESLNGFAEYVINNPETGEREERLAFIKESEDLKHVVVVEAQLTVYDDLLHQIVSKVRFLTGIAVASLMLILYLLYQNFIVLIDPISEQRRGTI